MPQEKQRFWESYDLTHKEKEKRLDKWVLCLKKKKKQFKIGYNIKIKQEDQLFFSAKVIM